MPYTATVTRNNTILPDQHLYQAGDTVTLSDADYTTMGSTIRAAVLTGITGAAGTAVASASGITGATSPVRIVGGNAAGAPTTGTFNARDEVIDTDGTVWVCTVAGTPGTWVQATGGSSVTFGTPGSSAVGDAVTAGVATSASHSDHVHGREGFGGVVAQTAFGAASGNGTAPTLAHSDHTHGTPAAPTTGSLGAMNAVAPTAVKATAYTAVAGDLVPVDTTSGAVTITLPSAPADKTVIGVKHVVQGSTNAVTVTRGGTDVFNKAAGPTSLTIPLVGQGVLLQYASSSGIWHAIYELPLAPMDTRYPLASTLGAASGIATLDGTSHLTAAQLPTNVLTAFGSAGTSAVGDAAAAGSATSASHSDHVHGREAFGGAPATTLAIGTAATAGSAATPSRSDHVHPVAASAAAGASAVGDTAAAGVATTFAASDHRHAREAFAAPTATTAYGLSAVTGTAATLAHSDHTHGTPGLTVTLPGTTLAIGTAAALGSATLPALADHVHPVAAAGTPTTSAPGDAVTTGSAATFAASDHRHGREAAPAAGAMVLLDHQLLGSSAASVTITLGSTYSRIMVVYRANLASGSAQDMYMRVDADSGAHYTWGKTSGNGGGTSSPNATVNDSKANCGVVSSQNAGTYFGVGQITFTGWNSTTTNLNWVENCIGFATGLMWTEVYGGMYTGAFGPHTTLTFLPQTNSFSAGTEFTTYGLA